MPSVRLSVNVYCNACFVGPCALQKPKPALLEFKGHSIPPVMNMWRVIHVATVYSTGNCIVYYSTIEMH